MRKRAGLSQVDLAERAGVTQSVISSYESGQRPPSLPALARLIDATGFELTPGLRGSHLIPAADLKPGVRERVESDLIAL